MKVLIKLTFLASNIILLTCSTKNSKDCNSRSQLAQQCACLSSNNAKYTTTCKWAAGKLLYEKEQQEEVIGVYLPNLSTCNHTDYKIQLRVNEAVVAVDACHTNFNTTIALSNIAWRKHSEVKYNVYNLQQCSSSTCNKQNNSILTVTFDYIFSGCYILEIFDETRFLLYQSYRTFIPSNYKKKRLVDKDVIATSKAQFRESQEFEITIKMNATHILKPPSISTTLKTEFSYKQNSVMLIAETQVNYKANKYKEYSKTFTRCNEFVNITWNCTYSEETKELNNIIWYICKYTGLTAGSYVYGYSLLDEYTRCNADSLWAYPGNSCHWLTKIDVPEYKSNNTTSYGEPTEDVLAGYIIIPIVIVIILLCLLKILHKKYCKLNKNNQAPLEDSYPYLLRDEELPLPNTQEILIIYSRDSEEFTVMIESFKQLLSSVNKNVSVYDINVHNEAMCEDSENWMRNKILNKSTKLILFLNNCGSIIFANQESSWKIAYRNEKWLDKMFKYAINILQNKKVNYRNLFVVVTIFCNTSVFDHINPGTRFVMPNSIEELLQHVFPSVKHWDELFLNNFNDCCREYNEFCEKNSDYVNDILKIE